MGDRTGFRRWEAILSRSGDRDPTWQLGAMLSCYERRPGGEDSFAGGLTGELHAHYTGGFVSILLWGRYLEHIARGVRQWSTGQMVCESFEVHERRSGSVRLYGPRDYHEIKVETPVAWSLCLWWGRHVAGRVKTAEVRR